MRALAALNVFRNSCSRNDAWSWVVSWTIMDCLGRPGAKYVFRFPRRAPIGPALLALLPLRRTAREEAWWCMEWLWGTGTSTMSEESTVLLRNCVSYSSRWMPSAQPPVLAPCSLHQSRLVIHPIGRSGSEFSTNVLHLVRQSALLRSLVVKSRVTGPRRRATLCPRDFQGESCKHPLIPFRCRLSSHCCCCHCCPLIQALFRWSLHLFRSPCLIGASVTSGGESIFAASGESTAWVLFWKTRSRSIGREGLSCSPSQLFQHRIWSARVDNGLRYGKENVGRQPHLITPKNEGDETSYPSPPKFLDDPDVPFGPGGSPQSPGPPGPPGQPGLPPGWPSSSNHLLVIEKEWDLEMHRVSGYLCDLHHPSLNLFLMSDGDHDHAPQEERQTVTV